MIAEHYEKQKPFLVALDCIIFGFDQNELKVLLIRRDFEPGKGKWSLIGGFLHDQESLDDAANRILHNLTGLKDIYLEQLYTFGDVDRDPVSRTVSVAYYALIDIHKHDKDLVQKFDAQWFPVSQIPELIFDHDEMVEKAKHRLRYKASYQPVGFELLPDEFTLPELQHLYEAIYDSKLDKRNFRRRILSMNVLVNTGNKSKKHSKKGAYLYRFDNDKFQSNITKGDNTTFKPLNSLTEQ